MALSIEPDLITDVIKIRLPHDHIIFVKIISKTEQLKHTDINYCRTNADIYKRLSTSRRILDPGRQALNPFIGYCKLKQKGSLNC